MNRTRSGGVARSSVYLLAWIGLAELAHATGQDPLRASDFAYGRVIQVESARALQSVSLDLDVYRHSVESGLADLRVFDANGEPVPHAIRHAPTPPASEARLEPLPVFRLDTGAPAASGSEAFEIDAKISETGAIVHLRSLNPSSTNPATAGTWLVDARSLDNEPVVGLELDLAPGAEDFVAQMRVEATNDLTRFDTLVANAALARFSRGAYEIERLALDLPETRARYLRLTLIDGALPTDLQGVSARIATPPAPPERQHTRLAGTPVAGEPGTFLYDIRDIGADLPIERIDVLPGEPNTLLEIQIDSALTAKGPWTRRHSGLVYRLEPGGTLRSAPISWRVGDQHLLRLIVSPKGGGDQHAQPEIDVEWRPAQLVFVARGEGPFTLAYGKRGAVDTAFEASRLVQLAGDERARLDETTATLGPSMRLAGELAYEPPPKPVAWRQIVLWVVLVLTVGSVLWLSVRLLGGAANSDSGSDRSNS